MDNDILIYSHDTGYGVAAFYAVVLLALPVGVFFLARAFLSARGITLPAPGIVVPASGALFLFVFILMLVNVRYAIRFAKKPVLILDSRGITDQTGLFSLGVIHWHEIEELFCCEMYTAGPGTGSRRKENALGVRVRDREGILSRFGLLTRLMIRRRSRPGFFIIRTSGLQITGNNVSALVLKATKSFPVKVGALRGTRDKA